MAHDRVARGPAALKRFVTFIALLVGGAGMGPQLAQAVAPSSATAEFLSFLMLPFSLVVGLSLWVGLATFARLLTSRGRRAKAEADAPDARRGAFVFLPVSVALCGAVGLLVALLPSSTSLVGTLVAYLMVGVLYGVLAWQLAQHGLLPTVENMNE